MDALAQETAERLITLEDQHIQIQTHLEEFHRLLRQQGHPILAHTVEWVKEVLQANIAKAREHMHAMVSHTESRWLGMLVSTSL